MIPAPICRRTAEFRGECRGGFAPGGVSPIGGAANPRGIFAMKPVPRIQWLVALVLACVPLGAVAQTRVDPFRLHLPQNRTFDAARAWARADVVDAMQTMLNSEGDAMTLQIQGGFSAGLFVNGGARLSFQAHLARGFDGQPYYEISIGADVAATAGVELVEGVEGNAALSVGGSTVYRFSSLADAARGIDALIVATASDSLVGSRFIANRQKTVASARKALRTASKALKALRSATPKFMRKWRSFKRAFARHSRAIRQARALLGRASTLLKQYGKFTAGVKKARAYLDRNRECREFRIALQGSVEAALGIPGLSLEGLGAGASATATGTVTVRVFAKRGTVRVVGIERSFESAVELWAAAVVGGELAQTHSIGYSDTIELRNGRYARTLEQSLTITADTAVRGSVGVGIAGKYGIGRTMSFTIDRADLVRVQRSFLLAFLQVRSAGDFNRLISIAGSLPVEFSLQDRYDAGLKAKVGMSGAGNGAEVSGSAFWHDCGVHAVETLTIAEALGRLQQAPLVRQVDAAAAKAAAIARRAL